jgi:hypothetical protein
MVLLLSILNFFNDRFDHQSGREQFCAASDHLRKQRAALTIDVSDARQIDAHGFAIQLRLRVPPARFQYVDPSIRQLALDQQVPPRPIANLADSYQRTSPPITTVVAQAGCQTRSSRVTRLTDGKCEDCEITVGGLCVVCRWRPAKVAVYHHRRRDFTARSARSKRGD